MIFQLGFFSLDFLAWIFQLGFFSLDFLAWILRHGQRAVALAGVAEFLEG
jgi:hypothetical protein